MAKRMHSDYMEELTRIIEEEQNHNLESITICSIPIWRIFRFKERTKHLDLTFFSKSRKIKLKEMILSYKVSCLNLLRLLRSNNSYDNIVFAFPRLTRIDGMYCDKFTDPVIDHSDIKKSFLIFQKDLSGQHFSPRHNKDHVIDLDAINYTANLLGIPLFPFIYLFSLRKLITLYSKARKIYTLNAKDFILFSYKLAVFLVQRTMCGFVLRKTKAKRIFVVSREVFFPAIVAAKKLNIPSYEFQHGITRSPTVLYGGKYNQSIDPDYFMVFGEYWKNNHFGIPLERIMNIGWGYPMMLKHIKIFDKFDDNTVLIISSPIIAEKILALTLKLGTLYPHTVFHIRLHPKEVLSKKQKEEIKRHSNIRLNDNSIDSSISLLRYDKVIGENSSVMYEALSLGKKVGVINMEGIKTPPLQDGDDSGFFRINNFSDFERFMSGVENEGIIRKQAFYSSFNPVIVHDILK